MTNHIEPKAKTIALKSYTAWAFYILAALTIAPEAIYRFGGIDTNPIVWGWLQIITIIFGIVGRLIIQRKRTKWIRAAIIAGLVGIIAIVSVPALAASPSEDIAAPPALVLADPFDRAVVPLIIRWEGKHMRGGWHVAYLDIVDVPTICYGSTRGVRLGMRMSESECQTLLAREIADYRWRLYPAWTDDTVKHRLPPDREAAFVSLAYNVGVRRTAGSTAVRRLNAGRVKPACQALTWWNKAGGRVVRGLVNRRSAERDMCLRGRS